MESDPDPGLKHMERLYDPEVCRSVTDLYPDYFTFDVESWLANSANHAYVEGPNIGFGERKSRDGHYEVHFCFHGAKGREAISLSKRMLKALHNDTNFSLAVGLISEDNKRARWLIRQVGLKSLGLTDTGKNGICEIFYLTKDYFNDGI